MPHETMPTCVQRDESWKKEEKKDEERKKPRVRKRERNKRGEKEIEIEGEARKMAPKDVFIMDAGTDRRKRDSKSTLTSVISSPKIRQM